MYEKDFNPIKHQSQLIEADNFCVISFFFQGKIRLESSAVIELLLYILPPPPPSHMASYMSEGI